MFAGCVVANKIHRAGFAGFIEINEKLAGKQDGGAAIFKKSIAINIRKNSAQNRNFLSKKL